MYLFKYGRIKFIYLFCMGGWECRDESAGFLTVWVWGLSSAHQAWWQGRPLPTGSPHWSGSHPGSSVLVEVLNHGPLIYPLNFLCSPGRLSRLLPASPAEQL